MTRNPDEGRSATERTIDAQTHGRYLVLPGSDSARPLLVGFHGYGETAEEELNRLREIPGSDRWTLVSVQGLHQFYRRRTNEIVASWMTRQNRELAIADNIAYVARVIRALSDERSAGSTLVLAGFSQGVAMAFRAAVNLDRREIHRKFTCPTIDFIIQRSLQMSRRPLLCSPSTSLLSSRPSKCSRVT